MYNSIQEFLKDWDFESESTIKILSSLTDESLKQKVTGTGRSLGRLAWHLGATISEMGNLSQLNVEKIDDKYDPAVSAKAISDMYKRVAASLKEEVSNNWTDASLKENVNLYGEVWTKAMSLDATVKHQIHHRGQMTVLMRQAGLKVPGMYGPAYEEWAAIGMQPME
jgi:uncharacterized damage-inducible protein DinB